MDTSEMMVDGNALAGPLGEIFMHDMTDAKILCGGCGVTEPIGAEHVYLHAPGVVMRCAHCEDVLLVMTRTRHTHVVGFGVETRLEIGSED